MKVFLEDYYNLMVVAHLLTTIVLVGAMTHNLLIVLKYVRGKFGRKKIDRFLLAAGLATREQIEAAKPMTTGR